MRRASAEPLIVVEMASDPDLKDRIVLRVLRPWNWELGYVNPATVLESIVREEAIIARAGDDLAGYLHFHKRRDGVVKIYTIATNPLFMRTKAGKRMVQFLERRFPDNIIETKVMKKNGRACDFFQDLGFEYITTEQGNKSEVNVYRYYPRDRRTR